MEHIFLHLTLKNDGKLAPLFFNQLGFPVNGRWFQEESETLRLKMWISTLF